jgi:hypothetical protein
MMLTKVSSNLRVRRAIYSLLIASVGLTAFYVYVFVWPNPYKWYYNATANGFLLFVTTILAVVCGVPAWAMTFLALTIIKIPRSPKKTGDMSEL